MPEDIYWVKLEKILKEQDQIVQGKNARPYQKNLHFVKNAVVFIVSIKSHDDIISSCCIVYNVKKFKEKIKTVNTKLAYTISFFCHFQSK